MALDPDQLADALSSADAHIDLDCPLAVVEAMRAIAIDRDNLRAEVASLRGRLAGAELEILNRVAVISVLTGEVPQPIEHVDPAWLMTLRHAGCL